MLCEFCKKREAVMHITVVDKGVKMGVNICAQCAKERNAESPAKPFPFPLSDFLASMVETSSDDSLRQISCPNCGLTFDEFARTGHFGCGECYAAFGTHLDGLLRKIHGANRHDGKLPSMDPEKMLPLQEERKLREELRRAIEREDFEKAAELRDELKELTANEQ